MGGLPVLRIAPWMAADRWQFPNVTHTVPRKCCCWGAEMAVQICICAIYPKAGEMSVDAAGPVDSDHRVGPGPSTRPTEALLKQSGASAFRRRGIGLAKRQGGMCPRRGRLASTWMIASALELCGSTVGKTGIDADANGPCWTTLRRVNLPRPWGWVRLDIRQDAQRIRMCLAELTVLFLQAEGQTNPSCVFYTTRASITVQQLNPARDTRKEILSGAYAVGIETAARATFWLAETAITPPLVAASAGSLAPRSPGCWITLRVSSQLQARGMLGSLS